MGCLEPIPIYIIKNVKEKVKLDFTQIEEAKSAQQRVLIFQYDANDEQLETSPLRRALESGGYCLVIRIWKGGSRWWNLNQAKDVRKLAIAEMEGYRLAREALGTKIPQLLYASNKENESPWAVFEYVGEKSTRFDGALKLYNQYWTECMIEVRNEFGFPEPHPRWGRVPVSESLPYAMRILNQITIPLHRYMFENKDSISLTQIRHLCGDEPESYETGYTYKWMIPLYKRALRAMQESLRKATVPDTELTKSLRILEMCINELDKEVVIELPGVLVHMDSQPQNLIFARTQDKDPWCISSVLDWEDCAYGDPRFELLLLGRKVRENFSVSNIILKKNVPSHNTSFARCVQTVNKPKYSGISISRVFQI